MLTFAPVDPPAAAAWRRQNRDALRSCGRWPAPTPARSQSLPPEGDLCRQFPPLPMDSYLASAVFLARCASSAVRCSTPACGLGRTPFASSHCDHTLLPSYDSVVMRQFAGIDLGREPVPDETTVCRFRHLLEEHGLGGEMLEAVNLHLQERGVRITSGTIVDATIIHAPSSTKNREQKRDPQMHQTRKGNQWYFGMKAHVGVVSRTKIIHSAVATAASVADMHALLHGEETRVWGDQAYKGQTSVIQQCAPRARDCTHRQYRFKDRVDETERARNRTKSKVRSRVEHVFQIMKLKFGFVKVRYRGIRKNANRLFATCALVNLYMLRRTLLCPVAV